MLFGQEVQCLFVIGCFEDVVFFEFEGYVEQLLDVGVVVYDQDGFGYEVFFVGRLMVELLKILFVLFIFDCGIMC